MNDQAISPHPPAHTVAIESGSKTRPLMLLLVLVALVGIATGTVALLAHRTVAGTPVTPPAATLGAEPGGASSATDASASSGGATPLPGLSAQQSALVRRLPVGLVDEHSCKPMAAEKAVLARVNCHLRSGPAAVTVYATAYRSDAELTADVKYEALGDEPSGPCGDGREHVQSTWSAGDGTASGPLHCGGTLGSTALALHRDGIPDGRRRPGATVLPGLKALYRRLDRCRRAHPRTGDLVADVDRPQRVVAPLN